MKRGIVLLKAKRIAVTACTPSVSLGFGASAVSFRRLTLPDAESQYSNCLFFTHQRIPYALHRLRFFASFHYITCCSLPSLCAVPCNSSSPHSNGESELQHLLRSHHSAYIPGLERRDNSSDHGIIHTPRPQFGLLHRRSLHTLLRVTFYTGLNQGDRNGFFALLACPSFPVLE